MLWGHDDKTYLDKKQMYCEISLHRSKVKQRQVNALSQPQKSLIIGNQTIISDERQGIHSQLSDQLRTMDVSSRPMRRQGSQVVIDDALEELQGDIAMGGE